MRDMSMMAPADIAAAYGGDKRKIGRAVQMGLLDPTAAVMAGMFIDRMRASASSEQQSQTTVAEDALNERPMPYERAEVPSGGVASLPVDESMYNMAGGGIVAFAGDEGSFVESSPGFYELEEETPGAKKDPDLMMLEKFMKHREGLRERLPKEQREAAKKFYEGAGERAEKAADKQKWMAGLAAASKLLTTRGDLAKALGAAGEAAAPGLQTASEAMSGAEEAKLKGLLGLEEKERAEALEDIKGAESLAGKVIDRRMARDTDAKSRVTSYIAAEKEKIAAGKRPPATDAELANEGWSKHYSEITGPRAVQAEAAGLRSKTDVDQAIANERKNMRSTIDMANIPIRAGMPQNTKDMINKAKAEVAAMEARHAEMRRNASISSPAPAGGGGGGRGQVDTSNPLLR